MKNDTRRTPRGKSGSGVPEATQLEAHVAQILAKKQSEDEQRASVEGLLATIASVYRAVDRCRFGGYAMEFQEWKNEDWARWVSRLPMEEYAKGWVDVAMQSAIISLKSVDPRLRKFIDTLLFQSESKNRLESAAPRIQVVRTAFLDLYTTGAADPEVRGGVAHQLGVVLTAERGAIEHYHWYFDGLANSISELHRRLQGGAETTTVEEIIESFRLSILPQTRPVSSGAEVAKVEKSPSAGAVRKAARVRDPMLDQAASQRKDLDRRIFELSRARGGRTNAELGRDFGMSDKDVARSIDRHRKQLSLSRNRARKRGSE